MAGPQIQPPRPTLMVLTGRVRPARRPMSSGTAGIAAVLVLGPLTWCLGILRRALALGPGCSSSLDRGGRGGLACWGGQREELGRGRRSRRSGLQLRTRGRQCLGRRRGPLHVRQACPQLVHHLGHQVLPRERGETHPDLHELRGAHRCSGGSSARRSSTRQAWPRPWLPIVCPSVSGSPVGWTLSGSPCLWLRSCSWGFYPFLVSSGVGHTRP